MKKNNGFQWGTSIFICQFVSLSVRQLEEASTFDLYTFFMPIEKGKKAGKNG